MAGVAILLLSPRGAETAARLKARVGDAEIWGLRARVPDADRHFDDTGATLRELYRSGTAIIGLCAAGILIRALAPTLSDKRGEPPVLAVSDDGAAVVPLLGGLTGANELARDIAEGLGAEAAITASGSRRFGLQLEAPPDGYRLANPQDAKRITSALITGQSARLEGRAPWLANSGLPLAGNGTITLKVTPLAEEPPAGGLLYHPRSVMALVSGAADADGMRDALAEAGLAAAALAVIVVADGHEMPYGLHATARELGCEIRIVPDLGTLANGCAQRVRRGGIAIVSAEEPVDLAGIGRKPGHLAVVGLGPGDPAYLTPAARRALEEADDLVGYRTYLDLVPPMASGPRRHASGNRVELDRAREALRLAAEGRRVVIVSSGDPGIFAMSAALMEALEAKPDEWTGIEIDILPGISAMQVAAARLGAPLGHDFAVLSLSDIRKPWHVIERRLRAAAAGDFVVALYNPASTKRRDQIEHARDILLEHRAPETPVVLGRDLGRDGEATKLIALGDLNRDNVDMRTVVIVGSSRSRTFRGPGGRVFAYAPRSHEDE